jgi:hypothetical protein
MEPNENRLNLMMALVTGMYVTIRSTLTELPIPISLPDIDADNVDMLDCLRALMTARDLIEQEPITNAHKGAYSQAILKWFTAWELVNLATIAGPAPWRLDGAQLALVEMGAIIGDIESGDLDA